MAFPRMFKLRQKFDGPQVQDIPATVAAELTRLKLGKKVKTGASVAVTAGSRGINNIAVVIKAVVEHLKGVGAEPFIVPAMGSHGGGTAEGQRAIIEHYGVTESFVGAPIRASMETILVGKTADGIPVHFDKHASQADHVVVVGRVKPHTDFHGSIESGMMKMMLIGLGKHEGAKVYHRAIRDLSFDRIVRTVGRLVMKNMPILCGVAILENGYDQTAKIEAVIAEDIEDREKDLLKLAKKWMPHLPFQKVDLLIVDEMGKNISGAGMDTNVIGRKPALGASAPVVTRIFVRDLTHETLGNAAGIGNADFTTRRLVEKTDWQATIINCTTGGSPRSAARPIVHECDRDAILMGLTTIGYTEPENARVVHIKNTLELGAVEASEVYLKELKGRKDLEQVSKPAEMTFDATGNLPSGEHAHESARAAG
jgi:hypothetical protein